MGMGKDMVAKGIKFLANVLPDIPLSLVMRVGLRFFEEAN